MPDNVLREAIDLIKRKPPSWKLRAFRKLLVSALNGSPLGRLLLADFLYRTRGFRGEREISRALLTLNLLEDTNQDITERSIHLLEKLRSGSENRKIPPKRHIFAGMVLSIFLLFIFIGSFNGNHPSHGLNERNIFDDEDVARLSNHIKTTYPLGVALRSAKIDVDRCRDWVNDISQDIFRRRSLFEEHCTEDAQELNQAFHEYYHSLNMIRILDDDIVLQAINAIDGPDTSCATTTWANFLTVRNKSISTDVASLHGLVPWDCVLGSN